MLWVMVFLLPGSVGHDPWKGDDATHFGVVWSMLQNGFDWVPRIAGVPQLDYPPLYHWFSAGLAQLLGWLLNAPDAARLATAAFAAILFAAVGLTAERWHGVAANAPAVLLTLGSLGLMVHAHETQPMMALVALAALGYLGLSQIDRHPLRGGVLAAIGLSGVALSGGVTGGVLLGPLWLLGPLALPCLRTRASLVSLALSALAAGVVCGGYLAVLHHAEPALLEVWLALEAQKLSTPGDLAALDDWLRMLVWFAWPVWPLALWAVWRQRHSLYAPALVLPLLYLACALAAVLLCTEARSVNALPLIAPLALLASAELHSLRRGAANALDWFAVTTFTLLVAFVWFAWNTLASGHPARFAATLERLGPDFVFRFSMLAVAIALALTLCWVWLLLNSPRSPWRGITHWAAGVILFWGLSASLLMPWVDHGKSYRPVVESLQSALRALPSGCIIGRDLGSSQRVSLDYFADIQTQNDAAAPTYCRLMLVQTTRTNPAPAPDSPWSLRWEGARAGDRHELLRLYVRP